jgi:hypothetical protein
VVAKEADEYDNISLAGMIVLDAVVIPAAATRHSSLVVRLQPDLQGEEGASDMVANEEGSQKN